MNTQEITVWRLGDRVAIEMDVRYGVVHSLARDGSTVDVKFSDGRLFRIRATSPYLRRQP